MSRESMKKRESEKEKLLRRLLKQIEETYVLEKMYAEYMSKAQPNATDDIHQLV